MPHHRTLIRHYIHQILVDADTIAMGRVSRTRKVPHLRDSLPAISVYSPDEDVDGDSSSSAPRELTRKLSVVIEGYVHELSDTPADDVADELASQVEAAMGSDRFLGGNAGDSILSSTAFDIAIDGDRHVGVIRMVYEVTYRTFSPETVPESGLEDFDRVGATHNVSGDVNPDDVAEDLFTVSA